VSTSPSPDPATKVRFAGALNGAGKHDEAIKIVDELLADAMLHPAIRQIAQQEKMKAAQAKAAVKK
jgi:hypothetical protein